MMPDIFSSFDPIMFKSYIPSISLLLLISLSMILLLKTHLHPVQLRLTTLPLEAKEIILSQLLRTQSKHLKGLTTIITSLFLMLVMVNLLGMTPYLFSLSSHLIITLSLGFPLWLSLLISSFTLNPKSSMAHFLPDGAPDWLNPFLVLIETISVLVRPMTLSFRLAANMTAGHVVLNLLGIYCSSALLNLTNSSFILITLSSGYILFEFAICLIQAYIFCLLLTLYSDDHSA